MNFLELFGFERSRERLREQFREQLHIRVHSMKRERAIRRRSDTKEPSGAATEIDRGREKESD